MWANRSLFLLYSQFYDKNNIRMSSLVMIWTLVYRIVGVDILTFVFDKKYRNGDTAERAIAYLNKFIKRFKLRYICSLY